MNIKYFFLKLTGSTNKGSNIFQTYLMQNTRYVLGLCFSDLYYQILISFHSIKYFQQLIKKHSLANLQ